MVKKIRLRRDATRQMTAAGGSARTRRSNPVAEKRLTKVIAGLAIGLFSAYASSSLSATEVASRGLADLSIQELMNIEVTSASKKAQKLSEVPAAIFVITGEDIRRSGARNVPEALRMAPGVDVAAIGGGRYAVTIRGGNGRFANKLLVLVDGRSVYTPLFSGVVWETIGPVLENIDRIEVIRGPGAVVWGANAVNGVINIISKHSTDTQGVLVSGGTGTEDHGFATLQYGDHIFSNGSYRIYGKTESHGASDDASGQPGNDRNRSSHAGFRADDQLDDSALSMQGEVYGVATNDRLNVPAVIAPYSATTLDGQQHNSGSNLLVRWDKTLSPDQDISLQSYFDFFTLEIPGYSTNQQKTLDFEFEHRIRAGTRNDITWGLNYRSAGYRDNSGEFITFDPTSRSLRISGAFAQDEFRLTPESLRLTLGAKLEHDTYTGAHFMPNARLLWNVNASNQLWTAVSQAVRTPSVGEHDGRVGVNPVTPPSSTTPPNVCSLAQFDHCAIAPVTQPSNLGAERLTAYEVGYRSEFSDAFSLDITGFLHHYTELEISTPDFAGVSVASSDGNPYLLVPIVLGNGFSARETGVEAAADWRVNDWWRFQSSYSRTWLKYALPDATSHAFDASPRTLLSLRSSMDISGTHWDLWLRHVGERVATSSSPFIPEYTTLDSALSWNLPFNFDVSLVGKDLLKDRHPEFVSDGISSQPLTVDRSAYVRITWTY